ncbi:carboxyvinyl-carboxyphosphonate phosphorylmutase, partial [Azospirillum brasilense]|nr:carboxyvinyl-carboxyphosphonate phosphorylmutase [Azospirillum brasilense]
SRRLATDPGAPRPSSAHMVEGGQTPISSAADLGDLGYRLVIFPGGIGRALARQAQDYYGSLAQHGTTQPFRDRMFDFNALNDLIGTPEMLALGETYKDFTSANREDAA